MNRKATVNLRNTTIATYVGVTNLQVAEGVILIQTTTGEIVYPLDVVRSVRTEDLPDDS